MLLTIKKIKDVEARTKEGDVIKNPEDDKPVMREELFEESIDVWAIKSVRPFERDFNKEKHSIVKEELSVLYLYGEIKGRRSPSIHVVGNHLDLVKDINDLRARAPKNS